MRFVRQKSSLLEFLSQKLRGVGIGNANPAKKSKILELEPRERKTAEDSIRAGAPGSGSS